MSKNKYIVGASVSVVLAIGLAGWFWHQNDVHTRQLLALRIAAQKQSLETESGGSNSISLNDLSKQDAGGLSVDSGSKAAVLGQLSPSSGDPSSTGTTSPKKTPSPFDPTTFGQYEKYKDATAGLFGEVLAGTGAELTANKKAAVYYRGWLTNGQLFDESKPDSKGQLQPFVFTLGAHQVIPGWEQALEGMKVGAVRLVIVPPSVGYGATGQGSIPPNAVLIFQIQLAAVE